MLHWNYNPSIKWIMMPPFRPNMCKRCFPDVHYKKHFWWILTHFYFWQSFNAEAEVDTEAMPENEEQEEKRWTKRTQLMQHSLDVAFRYKNTLSFKEMSRNLNRKQACSKFYTLLVLKKFQAIQVQQPEEFGDIYIDKGPRFGMICWGNGEFVNLLLLKFMLLLVYHLIVLCSSLCPVIKLCHQLKPFISMWRFFKNFCYCYPTFLNFVCV